MEIIKNSYIVREKKKKQSLITIIQERINEIRVVYPLLWAGIIFFGLESIMAGWCLSNHKISYTIASLWTHTALLACSVMFILSLNKYDLSERVWACMVAMLICIFLYYPFL